MFLIIDTFTLYFTSFYFQNLNKQKYLFTFIVLRSSSYSNKIALKWTKIMLIWNPENQGYKIGYTISEITGAIPGVHFYTIPKSQE